MKVLLVRAVQYQQATSLPNNEGRCVPNASQGSYFEVVTWGWATGASYRTRKFLSIDLVFGYFNKLNTGKHLSDDAYTEAWDLALPFDRNIEGSLGITTMLAAKAEESAAEARRKKEAEELYQETVGLYRDMAEFCSGTDSAEHIKDFDELSAEERENFFSNVKRCCLLGS
jgi:hypothetical protein